MGSATKWFSIFLQTTNPEGSTTFMYHLWISSLKRLLARHLAPLPGPCLFISLLPQLVHPVQLLLLPLCNFCSCSCATSAPAPSLQLLLHIQLLLHATPPKWKYYYASSMVWGCLWMTLDEFWARPIFFRSKKHGKPCSNGWSTKHEQLQGMFLVNLLVHYWALSAVIHIYAMCF